MSNASIVLEGATVAAAPPAAIDDLAWGPFGQLVERGSGSRRSARVSAGTEIDEPSGGRSARFRPGASCNWHPPVPWHVLYAGRIQKRPSRTDARAVARAFWLVVRPVT